MERYNCFVLGPEICCFNLWCGSLWIKKIFHLKSLKIWFKKECGIFYNFLYFCFCLLQKSTLSDEEKLALQNWLQERNLIIVTQLEHIPSKIKLLIGNIHVTWTLFKCPNLQILQVCNILRCALQLKENEKCLFIWGESKLASPFTF